MKFNTIISAIALSSAMLLAGPAFAQTTINGMEVTADQMPVVQQACDTLALDVATDNATTTDSDKDEGDATDASGDDDTAADEGAAATSGMDLSGLTLEQCKDAGLVKSAM